jgi:peptidoglycan/LPS O-acetylase OafA/YrhL
MLFHEYFAVSSKPIFENKYQSMLFKHLGLLVDVFFFMSAYLNMHAASARLNKDHKNFNICLILKMYWNRLVRLYPAYFYAIIFWFSFHYLKLGGKSLDI